MTAKPKDIRKAQKTIEAMTAELGKDVQIYQPTTIDDEWTILYQISATPTGDPVPVATGTTLYDAYIAALHQIAGTEEAPF